MIKSNRKSDDSILSSGYRNRLKQYNQVQYSSKTSQASQSQYEDRVKMSESRGSSTQRAYNSRHVGNYGMGKQSNQIGYQTENQSRVSLTQTESQAENYPFYQIQHQQRPATTRISRHPSQLINRTQPFDQQHQTNRSQASSQVKTHIQTLNRLRQQHQILKHVTSDDEFRVSSYRVNQSSIHGKDGNQSQFQRRYINQLNESIPVQIVKNKKISEKERKSSKNPQENGQEHSENQYQREKQDTLDKKQQDNITSQHYLTEIRALQMELAKSSLKIEELLKQSLLNKEKLKQLNQTQERNLRLQNELKIMRDTERYLKRDLQIKEQQLRRGEKRLNIMKDTIAMIQKQSDLKDKQISALQALFIKSKSKEVSQVYSEEQFKKYVVDLAKNNGTKPPSEKDKQEENVKRSESIHEAQFNSIYGQMLRNTNQQLEMAQKRIQMLQDKNLKLSEELSVEKAKCDSLRQSSKDLNNRIAMYQQTEQRQNEQKASFIQQLLTLKTHHTQLTRQNSTLHHQIQHLTTKLTNIHQSSQTFPTLQVNHSPNPSQSITHNLPFEDQTNILLSLNYIKGQYRKLQESYLQKAKGNEGFRLQNEKMRQELSQVENILEQYQRQLQEERRYVGELQSKMRQKQLEMLQLLSTSQNNYAYNERISQLHQSLLTLQIQLKQHQHQKNQLQLKHKQQLTQRDIAYNDLNLKLSQSLNENVDLRNEIHQKEAQWKAAKQVYEGKVSELRQELEKKEGHFRQMDKLGKQSSEGQMKMFQEQVLKLVQEKQVLLEEKVHYAQVEYQVKSLLMREKHHRKLSQNIDHLWLIKQAQYHNINQLLNIYKSPNDQIQQIFD